MYVHPAFKVHPAASLAFAAARGFGVVIACDAGRPVGAHLPFRVIEQDGKVPKLEFHVARNNPLGAIAEKGGTWLVAVQGHDAYVSPDWYASKEQVPTWLYESVHLSGPVRVIPGEHTQAHTEALSAKFEGWIEGKQPWLLDKVAEKRREMLLKGIIAVEMTVETIEGNFKLNQHKARRGSCGDRDCARRAGRSVVAGDRPADGRDAPASRLPGAALAPSSKHHASRARSCGEIGRAPLYSD